MKAACGLETRAHYLSKPPDAGRGWIRKRLAVSALSLAVMLLAIMMSAQPGLSTPVDCIRVMREASRMTEQRKGRAPALGELSRRVGAPAAFVERCMHTFGRRIRREGAESRESAAALLEQLEEDEMEESFPEDVEEPGAVERPKREPRPRYLSIRPTPGVEEGSELLPGEWERYQEDLERERD
ncbi:MAG: hypothetical protein N3C12_13660 [Candidatus Binatia bacterium]|nr:hypothetical protein [Candidatus Binatia bacterium]